MRYEIRDIRMPARVQEAMQMQVEAERKKRAAILESEGIKAAEVNVAEGKKQARILQSGEMAERERMLVFFFFSFRTFFEIIITILLFGNPVFTLFCYLSEAEKQELINNAQGAAEAVVAAGRARAQSIELVATALGQNNGQNAAGLAVAEKYVTAFQELARTNNTLILPANTGDVTSMVAQVSSCGGEFPLGLSLPITY